MESRIEELRQKYWEGNTSLEEEAELKAYFTQNKTVGVEARYFDSLAKSRNPSQQFAHPGKNSRRRWMAVAASITIGVIAVAVFMQPTEPKDPFLVEDPQEAYEITRSAMMMMSTGLNQGAVVTTELKKINKAEEILTTN